MDYSEDVHNIMEQASLDQSGRDASVTLGVPGLLN
jgi:hypothetical protein